MSDYRASALRCPACASILDELQIGDALIDVCRQCRGVYLDWFDGEPREVAAELVAAEDTVRLGPEPPPLSGGCPRCGVPLAVELFQGRGPYVHRCGSCAGAFVDAASLGLLASTAVPDPARDAPPGVVARLVAVVRALLAPSPPPRA